MTNPHGLNLDPPSIMWIDLNSAFATAEQQAHPTLRGKPLGVTNRISRECCIIAASYEAKALGVKVGCRRSEALARCPELVLLETDPPKYHHVYRQLFAIMKTYSPKVKMKSIDEGVLDFHHLPAAGRAERLVTIGQEIKTRIKNEIGDYIKINIGIAPNRFLAKTAAGLHKPDGLDIITASNLIETYRTLELTDLTGIASAFSARLKSHGIMTPLDFLATPEFILKNIVFKGITGTYWYRRLRGFEIDDYRTKLGMVGRQWVVHNPTSDEEYLRSCLHHLAETVAIKLRYRNRSARGVCVWMHFAEGGSFSEKHTYSTPCYTNAEIWQRVYELFSKRPRRSRPRIIGLYLYNLTPSTRDQISLFEEAQKADQLTSALDSVNRTYGNFTLHSADSLTGAKIIKQKIPFGGTDYFNLLLDTR